MTFLSRANDMSARLVPVTADETVRPTRVVWRYSSNQFLTSRVFPTLERAYAFAAEQDDVVIVQDARERPPKQDARVNRAFVETPFAALTSAAPTKKSKKRP